MAPVEDIDSGMASGETSQADDKCICPADFNDEPDETLAERLLGLTEMFPESVRNVSYILYNSTETGIKSLYGFSRNALWVVFSTSIILFAPVIFEVERAQMEEMQRSQHKQMLLGPNTGASGPMPSPR